MSEPHETRLDGGWQTTVHRRGDAVHRSASPWSRDVIALLAHLESAGFAGSPRPVGAGFDPEGNELLSFVPGQSPQPAPWGDDAIVGVPTGFIDWDTAGPIDPVYELAQVAWLNVQLHDDDIAARVGLGDLAHRAHQLGLLLDAYGLDRAQRPGFVDKMVAVAVHDAAGEATEHDVTPDTETGLAEDGYPFAWGLAWRIRSAAWILRHRTTLAPAIGVTG